MTARKELGIKIVYCGPAFAGKSTSLIHIHENTSRKRRGKFMSLATEPRTVLFDFLPDNVGKIGGLDVRLHVMAAPVGPGYVESRKLFFKGMSGVVFVADSTIARMAANLEALEDLRRDLERHGLAFDQVPLVFQYNKRDLQDIVSVESLGSQLNTRGAPQIETVATKGLGVSDCLMKIVKLALQCFDDPDNSSMRLPNATP